MRGVRVLVASMSLCVAAGVVGCGTGSSPAVLQTGPVTAAFLTEAGGKTRFAGTGRIEGRWSVGSAGGLGDIHSSVDAAYTVTGEYDIAQRRHHLATTVSSYGASASVNGSAVSMPGGPTSKAGDVEEEVVDGDRRFKKRTESGRPPGEGRWVETSPTFPDSPLEAIWRMSGLGDDGQNMDPGALLDLIQRVGDDVTEVAHEEIRGQATRHLRASVSVARVYAEHVRSSGAHADEKEPCLRDALVGQTIPVDVFVDPEGYVRRIAMDGDLTALFERLNRCYASGTPGTAGTTLSMTLTFRTSVDYFDVGQPVTIVVPEGDQLAPGTTSAPRSPAAPGG